MNLQKDTLPNFLIVGAAKSGTTSLYHYLKQHPDVFMPGWKEPAFFAPPEAGGVTSEEEYRALFAAAKNKKAVGEASVAYLYAPEAPRRIYDFLGPDTKIIILLRNPVDMAYSNWGHQRREGYETLEFSKALEQENNRLNDPQFFEKTGTWAANLAYTARAHYREQLERYTSLFPANNILIYIYEDFFRKDLPFWVDLCNFLGIDTSFQPHAEQHNPSGIPRLHRLQQFLNRPSAFKEILKTFLPSDLRSKIKAAIQKLNRKSVKLNSMDPTLRKQLEMQFSDDVRWLETYIRRDLRKVWF